MSKQEKLFARIIDELYEGIIDPEAWISAMQHIVTLVGARGQMCVSVNPSTGNTFREQSFGYDAADAVAYHEHWAIKDPRFAPGLELSVGCPVTEHDLLPIRSFRKSEIFNEFLLPCDAPWLLGTSLHCSPTKWTYFSLYGSADRKPFGELARARVSRLVPHIRRSLEIQDRLNNANAQAAALSGALDQAVFEVLVLDSYGHILEATSDAIAALTKAGALKRDLGGHYTLRDPAGAQLRDFLKSSMRSGLPTNGSLQLSRGPGRPPLSLVVLPAPSFAATWFLNDVRWTGLLFDPDIRVAVSEDMLRDCLGLSAREAQVVALLVGGSSLKSIARELGISFHTVRAQLKSVFLKTNVNSQAELVRKVMTGPAARPLSAD